MSHAQLNIYKKRNISLTDFNYSYNMLEQYETLQLAGNLMKTNQVNLLQFMR